ncbi:MAG: hypothetical protein ACTSU5_07145 [Promethearchaeota archaeon]
MPSKEKGIAGNRVGIEEYALRHGRYHPVLVKFASQFVDIESITRAKVVIWKTESKRSGRAKKEGQEHSRTPAMVLLHRMHWGRGVLNKPGKHAGNSFDLSTPEGMALFLHEVWHVHQWFRGRLKLVLSYLRAVVESVLRKGILWAHEYIPFEVEAMVKQREWVRVLREEPLRSELEQFRELR